MDHSGPAPAVVHFSARSKALQRHFYAIEAATLNQLEQDLGL